MLYPGPAMVEQLSQARYFSVVKPRLSQLSSRIDKVKVLDR